MAIKIDTDSIVRVIHPDSSKFSLQDLNNLVDGFIEPLKIGPVWVMYDETAKANREPHNQIATFFFGTPMYGTVVIVPPQQLPEDWDIMDESDKHYSADDIDSGFLLSLQSALMQYRVFGVPGNDRMENLKEHFQGREEWTYQPPSKATIDLNTEDFYCQVYEFIHKNPDTFKKNIILDKSDLIIKIESVADRERMINQMIEYFVSREEYEKCTFLQSVL
jgi:hypothetical protein